jgi:hypothetical protein
MRSLPIRIPFFYFIDEMVKKIIAPTEAENLKPGDAILDGPDEEIAREFKLIMVLLDHVLAWHGGDFPSLKFIRRSKLASGNWWVRVRPGED